MEEKERMKKKHKGKKKVEKKNTKWFYHLSKVMITIILTLSTLIVLKQNMKFKEIFHKYIFEKNISFASINQFYEDKFGSTLPFKDLLSKDTETVFHEKLEYKEVSKYLDGARLTVNTNYLVPALQTGMVVFVGEKEGYGKTIVMEGTDGVEIWYGNLNKYDVKVYDYIDKGTYLGEAKGKNLYLVFKKDGKPLDYTKYVP